MYLRCFLLNWVLWFLVHSFSPRVRNINDSTSPTVKVLFRLFCSDLFVEKRTLLARAGLVLSKEVDGSPLSHDTEVFHTQFTESKACSDFLPPALCDHRLVNNTSVGGGEKHQTVV